MIIESNQTKRTASQRQLQGNFGFDRSIPTGQRSKGPQTSQNFDVLRVYFMSLFIR